MKHIYLAAKPNGMDHVAWMDEEGRGKAGGRGDFEILHNINVQNMTSENLH